MEELFQDSCRAVQTILDTDSGKSGRTFRLLSVNVWKNQNLSAAEAKRNPALSGIQSDAVCALSGQAGTADRCS